MLFSGNEQRIAGLVPNGLEVRGRFGYVELDLTRATLAEGVTTIDVRAFMGYVHMILPADVHIESHGRACPASESGRPPARVVNDHIMVTRRRCRLERLR